MYDDRRQIEPAVERNLELLDPELFPRWNVTNERWEVWRRSPTSPKYIMVVQDVDGSYLPFDNRVLQKLFVIDTAKYSNKWDFIRSLHLEDEKLYKKKRREQDEYIRACHRDMSPFLRGRKSISFGSSDR